VANDSEMTDDSPEHIKKLRAEAEQAKTLQRELERKERQIAFLQAGIDTESKIGQMLMKTYEGELTSDAIRNEAIEIGLIKTEEEPMSVPEVDETQAQFQQTRESFSGGNSAPHEPPQVSATDRAFDEWNNARKQGLSNADAQDMAFASFIAAAANGDSSAKFNDAQWQNDSQAFGHLG